VINPYAKHIELPEQVFKPRRTMTLLLGFIEAVTFYHQYQREVKRDENNQPYITTTIADIEAAFTLLKEVLFSKSDELTNATRHFLENLKVHINSSRLDSFKTQDIRKTFRLPPRNIQRYMKELHQYGYIKKLSSQAGRAGYEYAITDTQEYEQLQNAVDRHLQSILSRVASVNATMRQ
jgi:predicted transcriptional regulator